jgi:hypothetical protein
MSADREFLELAAKAANSADANIIWSVIWGCFVDIGADNDGPMTVPRWEPLTDQWQAEILAEQLGIGEVEPRAIVRAAAEIGRSMQRLVP